MDYLIETLEASLKRNGDIPLTVKHLLNLIKLAEKQRSLEEEDQGYDEGDRNVYKGNSMEIVRHRIEEKDEAELTRCMMSDFLAPFKHELAVNIRRQGWISSKQRACLHSKDRTFSSCRDNEDSRGGYDGAPDNAGNGYVTGE